MERWKEVRDINYVTSRDATRSGDSFRLVVLETGPISKSFKFLMFLSNNHLSQ